MKITIAKEHLLNGLQAVQNVVGSRTTLPILSNVLLNARGERLELTATDLDVTISCAVPATVSTDGAATIPVKKLFGICRELGSPEIELETDEKNSCAVRAGASFYRINGLAAEDYPPMPQFQKNRQVVVPQDKLRTMLRRTSFAVSTDETRFVLNGIFFSLKEHKLSLVATDGRRLALTESDVEVAPENHADFIVPTKAISELNRLLTDKGNIEIKFSENQVAFTLIAESGFNIVIISKLVDGSYPNYRQVIPAEPQERVTLPREEFLHALRRAELMTSEKSNSVKLAFTRNNLRITANTPDLGEAQENLAINYKGRDLAIAFNPIYMMDPLKALENDEVFLELIDELSPGVIKVSDPFLYVIMPMRMS